MHDTFLQVSCAFGVQKNSNQAALGLQTSRAKQDSREYSNLSCTCSLTHCSLSPTLRTVVYFVVALHGVHQVPATFTQPRFTGTFLANCRYEQFPVFVSCIIPSFPFHCLSFLGRTCCLESHSTSRSSVLFLLSILRLCNRVDRTFSDYTSPGKSPFFLLFL